MNIRAFCLTWFLCLVIGLSLKPLTAAENLSGSNLQISSDFFLEAEELELYKVAQELSLFFHKNVMVYPDCKNLKISCNIKDCDFDKALSLISWCAGIDYYEREGVYYLGGNKDYIEVIDNIGMGDGIEDVFGDAVKIVEDKIIVKGTEKEVNRIVKALKEVQNRDRVTVRIWGYEITTDKMLELGIDIDKAIEYSFSWQGLASYSYNPIQNWVMSLNASLEFDSSQDDLRMVLDTLVTSIPGKQQGFTVGEAIDRELYTVTNEGTTLQSGYQTLQTGYILNMTAYKSGQDWQFAVSVENSVEQTEKRRNKLQLTNTIFLQGRQPALVGRLIKNSESVQYKKGIPFLCDVPYFGYLFRVSTERKVTRNVLFFMQRVDDSEAGASAGATAPPDATPQELATPMLNFNDEMTRFLRSVEESGKSTLWRWF